MSRPEPEDWPEEPGGDWEEPISPRWPLSCEGLFPRERWMWFEQLWSDVCGLRVRYRLALRSGWWEDQIQVEALAALSAWVERYDSGEWDDPPGKLALLHDLERVAVLLRDGGEPFHPDRDRLAFARYLIEIASLRWFRKLRNIERDPRVSVSMLGLGLHPIGLREYLVVYGTARIEEGGAADLLRRLARVYIGPESTFPPDENPPPGWITRITPTRLGGAGPWTRGE